MNEIVRKLFSAHLFTEKEVGNDLLFMLTDDISKKAIFWLVVKERDLDVLIDRQSELFESCKKACQHDALEKNISLLVLWETSGSIDVRQLKKKIMSIEEDLYFFKKHVLYYSSEEQDSLKRELDGKDVRDFLKVQIASQSTFKKYKSNPLLQTWQALLYRTVIKLVFIKIDIDISDGLTSLFKTNRQQIEENIDKTLIDFDESFFGIVDSEAMFDIKNSKATDLLALLHPALIGGAANEN